MFYSSYSMRGMKIILAAVTTASIAQHFKQDYVTLSFNDIVTVLKRNDDSTGPDRVLERLFALEMKGATNIRSTIEEGLQQVGKFERKTGLILTDGAWNLGEILVISPIVLYNYIVNHNPDSIKMD